MEHCTKEHGRECIIGGVFDRGRVSVAKSMNIDCATLRVCETGCFVVVVSE
jgi:hypothetical protein